MTPACASRRSTATSLPTTKIVSTSPMPARAPIGVADDLAEIRHILKRIYDLARDRRTFCRQSIPAGHCCIKRSHDHSTGKSLVRARSVTARHVVWPLSCPCDGCRVNVGRKIYSLMITWPVNATVPIREKPAALRLLRQCQLQPGGCGLVSGAHPPFMTGGELRAGSTKPGPGGHGELAAA